MKIRKLSVTFFSVILLFANQAKADLNLQESIRSAYENNSDLKAQNYSVEAAKSQKQKSYSGFLPNVSADVNSGNQKTKIDSGATLKGNANKRSVNLSQDLFNGGSTYFDIKRATSVLNKEQADKDNKEQQIILSVIQSYLDILRFEDLVKIEQENLQSQEQMLEHTKTKLAARDATKSELAKAKADYASAISTKIAAENNLTSAKNSFAKLTGIFPNETGKLKKINDENFYKKISELNSSQLFEIALQNNPEIKSAKHSRDSAKHQSSITKSSFSPTVKLTLSSAEEKNPLYYSNQQYHNNSAYLNLHIPIFNSGVEYANLSEANNILQREKYNLEAAQNRVKQQIVEYVSKVKNLYAQWESSKEQEFANEIYVSALKEEERLGTKSIIDLLRARQDLYTVKVNRTNLHYDKITAIFSLKSLIGSLTYASLNADNTLSSFDEKIKFEEDIKTDAPEDSKKDLENSKTKSEEKIAEKIENKSEIKPTEKNTSQTSKPDLSKPSSVKIDQEIKSEPINQKTVKPKKNFKLITPAS
ncbi:MAG: hypothetical protein EBS06_05925 [Proteobacteria bacterium]|nr:hypothetical protein [Pseudomonadota bacterium]